jgi:FLVCR family MFS transporter 7
VGYSADVSGLMGACLLLSGIIAALLTAPLFDRVFTHHLAITSKILIPIVAGGWLSLIWAGTYTRSRCLPRLYKATVKPHNLAGLFVIMVILGTCSITMLPVGLELGCELTRNVNASSAVLWFAYVVAFVIIHN